MSSKWIIPLFLLGLLFVGTGILIGKSSNSSAPVVKVLPSPTPSVPSITLPTSRETSEAPKVEGSNVVKVTRVIDGDTIQVLLSGKVETVRLIGIDAPETVDPKKPVQCFGRQASDKAKEMLENKSVLLENDPTQGERDKYKRLLDFVFLQDGTNFDQFMLRQGYAREYTYKTPYKYQKEFRAAQELARNEKLGLWSSCPQ